jgi:hypothetical protein
MTLNQIFFDRKQIIALALLLCIALCLLISCMTIFTSAEDDGGADSGEQSYRNAIANIGVTIQRAGLAIGAIGIAFCAIKFMWGNDQESAKAVRLAIYIGMAVAALYLLPAVMKLARQIGNGHKWDPSHVNS